MYSPKPYDYLAWTRKNFPSLTDTERATLCFKLSEIEKSVANSTDREATIVWWVDAILALRKSIKQLLQVV